MKDGLYIAFAPLQGYTDSTYRRAHAECAGGVDEYFTPFLRLEGGVPRGKDLRDIGPDRNAGVPTAVQLISRDRDEFARLCDAVQALGWQRVDLNLGCPFPMQVRAGRGSGLLARPDRLAAIADEMRRRPDVGFSIKMRLGQDSADEGIALLQIINDMRLVQLTLHPRLGRQQYKGAPDREAFRRFAERCRQPMVYNGDLLTLQDISDLRRQMPALKGVMLGRGLLAQPWLLSDRQPLEVLSDMHERVYRHATATLCGDCQVLGRLHAFWEYHTALLDRRQLKAIRKATTLARYREAVAPLLRRQGVAEG